jgi:CRP/FNR family transcriptional regulator, cyclic AMP receptor protein
MITRVILIAWLETPPILADNLGGWTLGLGYFMDSFEGGLARVSLFSDVPAEAIRDIERRCHWYRFTAGEQVFDKESDTLEVYFVIEGAVRILTAAVDDREVALADVVAGNYFGELAAIDGMKRSARVLATRDAVLASLDGASFLDLMRTYPNIALRVLERLTRIVRNLDSRVTQLSTQGENQRVYSELVRLAQPDAARPDGWLISDLPNHKEIASWAGTSREQVAQAIGELARDGVVRRKGMGLVISDWSRLQLMAKAASAA